MKEWFLQLSDDLMGPTQRDERPERTYEVVHGRIHDLEAAVWRIKKAKGWDYEPSATEIYEERDRFHV